MTSAGHLTQGSLLPATTSRPDEMTEEISVPSESSCISPEEIHTTEIKEPVTEDPECQLITMEMEDSEDSEHQRRPCLICSTMFNVHDNTRRNSLETLCKCVKTPVKVTSPEVSEYLGARIYCDECEFKISYVAEALVELEQLQRLISSWTKEIKQTIMQSYSELEEHPGAVIRKSLVQCWSPCYIQLDAVQKLNDLATVEFTTGKDLNQAEIPSIAPSDDDQFETESYVEVWDPSKSPLSPTGSDDSVQFDIQVDTIGNSSGNRRSLRPRGKLKSWRTQFRADEIILDEGEGSDRDRQNTAPLRRRDSKKTEKIASSLKRSKFKCRRTTPSFKCSTCRAAFATQEIRDIHQLRRHKGILKPYKCDQCDRRFEKPSRLRAHERRWHSVEGGPPPAAPKSDKPAAFACDRCPQIFRLKKNLRAHQLRKHEGIPRPFICTKCDNAFRHQDELDNHLELHAAQDFPCEQCPKSFLFQRKLLNHRAKEHCDNETGNRFLCPKCPKNFSSVYLLEDHLAQHDGHKRYICEMCGQAYSSMNNLNVHRRFKHPADGQVQAPSKPTHNCDRCDKSFVDPGSLKSHVRSVHEKVFKFHCEVCGQGAQRLSMLKRHMLCHTEEKKHVCEMCGAAFKRPTQLVQHIYLHEGKNPYVCKICEKGFRSREKLKNHEKLHSGEKPFICELCGKSYALKHYLTNHVNTTHKGLKPRRRSKTGISEMKFTQTADEPAFLTTIGHF